MFLTWTGDHSPRHVHVYRAGRLVLKWNLDAQAPMAGTPSRRLLGLLERLAGEGLL